MSNVTIQKRGKFYQYKFEIAKVDGKRKFISKSGFKTKTEAEKEGILAYNDYLNTGSSFSVSDISYADFLDYWIENYCYVNLKYHTIEAYQNIIKNHIKPNIGFYRLSQITRAMLQEFINNIYIKKSFSKNFLNNIKKVIKCSMNYAYEYDYIKIELKRRIEDCLLADERINSVSNFQFTRGDDSLYVTFDVESIYGSTSINKEVDI